MYFSNEFKQYSSDVFWALLLCYLAVRAVQARHRRNWWVAGWSATVAVGVWFSHGAILTAAALLAGAGLLVVVGRRWRLLYPLAAAGAAYALSVGAEYVLALSKLSDNAFLRRYWATGMLPVPATAERVRRWLRSTGTGVVRHPLAFEHPWLVAALLLLGIAVLAWRARAVLPLLLLPAVVTFVAAAARQYPFAHRLILYLVPFTLILLAAPIDLARGRFRGARVTARSVAVPALALAAVVAGLAVLAVPQARLAGSHLARPERNTEFRAVLEQVRAGFRPGDAVLTDRGGEPFLEYYAPRLGVQVGRMAFAPAAAACPPATTEARLPGRFTRVWLVFGHRFTGEPVGFRNRYRAHLATVGRHLRSIDGAIAGGDLYDLTQPPDDPDRDSPQLAGKAATCLQVFPVT